MARRSIALILITVILMFSFVLTLKTAAEEYYEEDTTESESSSETGTVKPTVKPTQKPTEPPFTAEYYGYSEYVKKLEKTYYKGNLGATYTKDDTTFKLWSPAAKSVKVCIYTAGSDGEEYSQMVSENMMKYSKEYGTWYLTLDGDYKNKYYTYKVNIEGTVNEIVDPYAKAVGVNGNRGMIVDLKDTDPKGWDDDKFDRVENQTDAVIWEVSVRDFSSAANSGVSVENRGKFLAFTEKGTVVDGIEGEMSTCLDYLKELGVNYVQINPFYDFASIDESKPLDDQYNWGYDPKNYNVPEGSYSSDPYDGRVRIKECKQMIQALHEAGIGVIMDVVYNHTYESENSFLNQAVPNYYYRIGEDGTWSNGSGCGNDTASERIMFREFMKNSVMFWAEEYHIDGFRFDLMGLHDVDTMNYIRDSLDTLDDGEKILMYGEAWNLDTMSAPGVKLATQGNMSLLSDRIAAFNDTIRDSIKGSTFNETELGFIQEGSKKAGIRSGIEGMSLTDFASAPSQCVNYASCHDNLTLYDKLIASVKRNKMYDVRYEDLLSMNKLSAAIVLTSQGIPFMLAGEEFGRTKEGDSNSYKSSIDINEINWYTMNKYRELSNYYQGLIEIRKKLDILRDPTKTSASNIKYVENAGEGVVAYTLSDDDTTVVVVFNGSASAKTVKYDLSGDFIQLANETFAGLENLAVVSGGKVSVEPHSAAILVDEYTFKDIGKDFVTNYVFVDYVENEHNSIFHQQILEGDKGDKYSVTTPESVLFRYDVLTNSGNTTGEMNDKLTRVTLTCKPYKGKFGTVIFKYEDKDGNELSNSLMLTNREGQQYFTPSIASVEGYRLDMDDLPKNGAGKFKSDELTVFYRYIKEGEEDKDEKIDEKLIEEYPCVANVIYMASNGYILDKKTYRGTEGDAIDVEYKNFDNYQFMSNSEVDAVFEKGEKNIVLSYYKQEAEVPTLLFTIIGVFVLAVIVIVIIGVISNLKGKKREMMIDE